MKGLDTNVLLRFMVQDDEQQAARAGAFIAAHCSRDSPCLVNRHVLCEIAWVLERGYGYGREAVGAALDYMLRAEGLLIEEFESIVPALRAYRNGSADFADCVIAKTNRALGAVSTATFDRKAARMEEFELIAEGV